MIGNISCKPALSISGWWQTVDKNCFLAWFQGTAQLLEGRDILTQCPLGLRPWEPPQPGFFVMFQQSLGSVFLLYECVKFGVSTSECICPSVSVHKDSEEGDKSVSPIHEPFWLSVRLRCWKNRGHRWAANRACSYGSKFLTLFLVLVMKNPPANAGVIKRHGFDPWVRKIPWRRKWQPTPVFLPGNPLDREAWWATVHRVTKSWTQLSNYTCTYARKGMECSLIHDLSTE